MIRQDFHVHTTYCDGKNTPEEMVEAALSLGMTALGFSVHSYTPFDESYCIPKEKTAAYIEEIRQLKERFRDRIKILCGAEQDLYADSLYGRFDYTIGSLHYVKKNGVYYPVDESADTLKKAVRESWNGDFYAFAEDYFQTLAQMGRIKPSVIGHFDLLTKFSEQEALFDETHPRYVAAAKKALDALLALEIPFEINTGAISRGYRSTPYPSEPWLRYILEKGGKVILSSDAHSTSGLLFAFDKWEAFAASLGAKHFESLC